MVSTNNPGQGGGKQPRKPHIETRPLRTDELDRLRDEPKGENDIMMLMAGCNCVVSGEGVWGKLIVLQPDY